MARAARLRRAIAAVALVFVLGAQSQPPAANDPVSAGAHLLRPAVTIRERTASGLPVRIDFYAAPEAPFLAFRIDEAPSTAKPAPSLDEQGTLLDTMLVKLFSANPDKPAAFLFAPDTASLVDALRTRLLAPGANWDAKRGMPTQGRAVDVLKGELDRLLRQSAIAKAFETQGYALAVTGVGRVEMSDGKRGQPILPIAIAPINVTATERW